MKRRLQQLEPLCREDFDRKLQLLQIARKYAAGDDSAVKVIKSETERELRDVNKETVAVSPIPCLYQTAAPVSFRGTSHLKKNTKKNQAACNQGECKEAAAVINVQGAPPERVKAARKAAAEWRMDLRQRPECCSLFEECRAFSSPSENLKHMERKYGFFVSRLANVFSASLANSCECNGKQRVYYCLRCQIPESDYCINTAGLLRRLWREQLREPRCLYCRKRFSTVRSALQHMQMQRHFQLCWDENQQELLSKFYDFRKSYYEVCDSPNFAFKRVACFLVLR